MKGKKLISVFACSFLVLGGGTLLAVQSASKGEVRQVRADGEPNSTLVGVYSTTDFNNTEFATGYNNVLITYSGTAHGLPADPIQTSEVLDKITISSTSVWGIIPWAGQPWFKVIYPNTVAAGDVLEIQAGLTFGDAIFGNTLTLELNESLKWEVKPAEPTEPTDLGTLTFTNFNRDSTATAMYGISTTENEAPQGWSTDAFAPVDNDSGVFIGGDRVGSEIKKLGPTTYYINVPGGAIGKTATVKGTWANADYKFTINSVTRTWDGERWSIDTTDVGEIVFDTILSDTSATALYLHSTATNDMPADWANMDAKSAEAVTITKADDSTVDLSVSKIQKANIQSYYIALKTLNEESQSVPYTPANGDVLTIKGSWSGLSNEEHRFNFSISEFSIKFNGTNWQLTDFYADDVDLNGLCSSSVGPSNDHQLTLYATGTNEVPSDWTFSFTLESGDVRKNGMPVDGVTCKKVGAQAYFFEGFSVDTNDILKFDATFVGETAGYRYHFHILEYSIQYHGEENGWGLVDLNLGEIEFTQALPASSATAIYFYTEAINDIPYDPDWLHIYPDSTEQVLFNGNDITEGRTLQKANDHDYYFGLGSGRTAVAGDVLEISGSWTIDLGDYSYHFSVPHFALRYSGEVWQNLAQYKETIKGQLENYLDEDDYLPDDWDTAEQWIVNGKENIDLCTDFDDVDQMFEAFKENLDSIPTRTERAQEAAAEVDALIDEIIDINRRTYEGEKPKVVAARTAYDALSEEAKGYVTKLDTLERAEARVVDVEAAIAVDELIDAIGEVTLEKEQQILDARAAYDALTDGQSIYVLDLDVLVEAEDRLAELKELAAYKTQVLQALQQELQQILPNYRAEQQQQIQALALQAQTAIQNAETKDAVDAVVAQARAQLAEIPTKNQLDAKDVDDQIAALPAVADIALTDEDAIVAARAAYEALNSDAKALVTKLEVLQAAEARLAALKDAKADAEEFDALVEAIGEVTAADYATFMKINAAYEAYDALSDDAYEMITKEAEFVDAIDTYFDLLDEAIAAAKDRIDEIFGEIDMKKYSKDNQEYLQELTATAKDVLESDDIFCVEQIEELIAEYQELISEVPQKKAPAKKGCGGSIVATSIVLSTLALAGLGLAISKKRKED